MGQGFAPPSALATAEMIAGQQAQAAAEQALQAQQAPGQQAGQQPGQQGPSQPSSSQQAAQSQPPGQAAEPSESQGTTADPNRQGGGSKQAGPIGDSTADAAVGQPPVENESWFAKLPPETQESIRTKARRPAPRGYEEKLRRYFDSIGQ